jgi:3-methyl-2-oxobutanoate hydroxymethyltransferase
MLLDMATNDRVTLATLRARKRAKQKIVMLTAYDYPTACIEQQAGVDCVLVGDSVAQVMLGHTSTLPATMDLMVVLAAAVRRGAPEAYLVGDMPFLSYQVTQADAIRNAGRFMAEAGCDAVKVECNRELRDTVAAMTRASIPVMVHLGLRPQSIHQLGGYRSQGRCAEAARRLIEDAKIMEEAGAAALLLEAVPAEPARIIAEGTPLPVIGCGAGPYCDGHVVVLQDMLGLSGPTVPRFVPKYADLRTAIGEAVRQYIADIRSGAYPTAEQCYQMEPGEAEKLGAGQGQRNTGPPPDGRGSIPG